MTGKTKLELTNPELKALVFWAEVGMAQSKGGSYVNRMSEVWKKVYQHNPRWLGDVSETKTDSVLYEVEDKAFFVSKKIKGVK